MSRKSQLICAWSGPAFVVMYLVGFWPLARFMPPPRPAASAEEVVAFYQRHVNGIRFGQMLGFISLALFATFGGVIAARTRRTEGAIPVWTYVQLACVGAATGLATLTPIIWALAAFRPGAVSADITLVMNDLGWFLFLITYPVFSLWFLAIAAAILLNESEYPLFPRWVAYLNIWTAVSFIPAGLVIFFKDGAFAYDGTLGLYVPLICFFAWLVVMTAKLVKAINAESAEPLRPRDGQMAPLPAVVR